MHLMETHSFSFIEKKKTTDRHLRKTNFLDLYEYLARDSEQFILNNQYHHS